MSKNGQKMLKIATNLVKNAFFENGDCALDIFCMKSQNDTCLALQMKAFGPKIVQITCWQFLESQKG